MVASGVAGLDQSEAASMATTNDANARKDARPGGASNAVRAPRQHLAQPGLWGRISALDTIPLHPLGHTPLWGGGMGLFVV